MSNSLKVLTWNLERHRMTSPKGSLATDYLFALEPDLMFLTETRTDFPQKNGFTAFGTNPGSYFEATECKIAIWSKYPLEEFDTIGDPDLPPHRYLSALVITPIGKIRVICICIPWHMANVRDKQNKKKPWQSHIDYLEILPTIVRKFAEPLIIAGDFNQRIPRVKYGNIKAADAIQKCFQELDMDIVTKGIIDGVNKPGIDHIAISRHLRSDKVFGWSNVVDGKTVSDHDGAGCELSI